MQFSAELAAKVRRKVGLKQGQVNVNKLVGVPHEASNKRTTASKHLTTGPRSLHTTYNIRTSLYAIVLMRWSML